MSCCNLKKIERLFRSKNLPPPPTKSNNFKINAKHVEHAPDVHFHEDFYMFNKHNTFSPEKKKHRAVSSLLGLMTKICWTVERPSDGHLGNRVGTCKKFIDNKFHTYTPSGHR